MDDQSSVDGFSGSGPGKKGRVAVHNRIWRPDRQLAILGKKKAVEPCTS
jgi:hypothetical protein